MEVLKSDIILLQGAANSMQGGRNENQDDMTFCDTPLGFLLVICDGMGGGPGGKTAAYIVKYEMSMALSACNAQMPRGQALRMAAARANEALERKMAEVPALNGMGATFIAVLIDEKEAIIAHAGDSRCYCFRGKRLTYRSKDHSLVAELVARKVLTEEEARLSPQSNVITRGLGSTTNHLPDVDVIPYKKGDRFVLCTDGVWGRMTNRDLTLRFTQKKYLPTLVSDISTEIDHMGFANGGGHDNHTLAIFEVAQTSLTQKKLEHRLRIIVSVTMVVIAVITLVLFLLFGDKLKFVKVNDVGGSYVTDTNGSITGSSPTQTTAGSDVKKVEPQGTLQGDGHKNEADTTKPDTIQRSDSSAANHGSLTDNKDLRTVLRNLKETDRTDTTAQSNKKNVAENKREELAGMVQKVIKCYSDASNIHNKQLKKAQAEMGRCRKEIVNLLTDLQAALINDSAAVTLCKNITNAVDAPRTWKIDKPDAKDMYRPTYKFQKQIERQIERLGDLKKKIQGKDTEN